MWVTTIIDERHANHVTRVVEKREVKDEYLGDSDMATKTIARCYTCDSTQDSEYVYVYTRTDVEKVDRAPYSPADTSIVRIGKGKCLGCGEKVTSTIEYMADYPRCVRCDMKLKREYDGDTRIEPQHLMALSSDADGKRHTLTELLGQGAG